VTGTLSSSCPCSSLVLQSHGVLQSRYCLRCAGQPARPQVHRSFVASQVVGPFLPLTRSVADLRAVAATLWRPYVAPLLASLAREVRA
jgi:hypothetical protein